jgi:hypothetical protein
VAQLGPRIVLAPERVTVLEVALELLIAREAVLELPIAPAVELVIAREAAQAPSRLTAQVAGRTLVPAAETPRANRAAEQPPARAVAAAQVRSVTAASPQSTGAVATPSAVAAAAEALRGLPAAGEVIAWAAAV